MRKETRQRYTKKITEKRPEKRTEKRQKGIPVRGRKLSIQCVYKFY